MKQLLYAFLLVGLMGAACASSTSETEQISNNENTSKPSLPSTSEVSEPTLVEEANNAENVEIVTTTTTTTDVTTPTVVKDNTKKVVSTKNTEVTTTENKEPKSKPIPEPTPVSTNNTGSNNGSSKPAKVTTTTTTTTTDSKPARETLSHDAFDELLRKYVNSAGGVDYEGFKSSIKIVAQYLELLKNNPPQSSWSKDKEMAYWINMYNAFTIHAVIEKYPINSVMDLEGGKVWDKKKITVAGNSLTLNIIEKEKLLKRFKDPRVHFAVNCAAASCPPLLNKAWTEDNISRYLDKQAKAFINNSKYNSIGKSLEISQIFNWYAGDFGGSDKIIPYLQKYVDEQMNPNAKVTFKEYDWKLNKK